MSKLVHCGLTGQKGPRRMRITFPEPRVAALQELMSQGTKVELQIGHQTKLEQERGEQRVVLRFTDPRDLKARKIRNSLSMERTPDGSSYLVAIVPLGGRLPWLKNIRRQRVNEVVLTGDNELTLMLERPALEPQPKPRTSREMQDPAPALERVVQSLKNFRGEGGPLRMPSQPATPAVPDAVYSTVTRYALHPEKETSGCHRYRRAGGAPGIETLYLRKTCLGDRSAPTTILVSVIEIEDRAGGEHEDIGG